MEELRKKAIAVPLKPDVGQLGAIAVIPTFLNYFLERNLEKYQVGNARTLSHSGLAHEI